jgi:transcription antitermination protein NusB
MLTRRQLRIKAMQAFYAHQVTGSSLQKAINMLEDSLDNVFQLFLMEMKALGEFHRLEEERLERGKKKKMPAPEDLAPNLTMVENPLLKKVRFDENLTALFNEHSVRWGDDRELLSTVYKKMISGKEYLEYMALTNPTGEQHRSFVMEMYSAYFAHNEVLHELYEERNIHWTDDLEAAQMMVVFTLNESSPDEVQPLTLPALYKDNEDLDFTLELLRKSIQNEDYFEELIAAQTKNWESDRIAVVDKLLMKMALAELIYFTQIPVKVTFNEYIELTKLFSTSRSGTFINGVLDKLVAQLTESKQIRKAGRGLL